MAMLGSTVRTAWLLLITLAAIIYRSAGEPSQLIVCTQPDNFTVQITENEHVVVYGTELLIRYNPHVRVFAYPGTNVANIVFDESTVQFKGHMLSGYSMTGSEFSSEELSWNTNGILLGIGTLQELSTKYYTVRECRLLLPPNTKGSANLPLAVENKVIDQARTCIEEYICQEIGNIKADEIKNINRSVADIIVPSNYQEHISPSCDTSSKDTVHATRVDLNINSPVNLAVKNAVKYIERSGQTIVKLPDIKETYKKGPFTAKIEAFNGTFRDLSTLIRTEDAIISNVGETYVIQAGFGLSTSIFHYGSYKLKFGFAKINGKIFGTIEGLALAAKMTIHYEETCAAHLDYIKVREFGKIKLSMTGLGPFNSLTSDLLSWFTKIWRNDIIKLIEVNLKDAVQEEINKYICKIYEDTNTE